MGAGGHAAEKATHTILPHHIRGKAMKPKYFHISHHCEKVSDIPSKAVRKVMRQAFHIIHHETLCPGNIWAFATMQVEKSYALAQKATAVREEPCTHKKNGSKLPKQSPKPPEDHVL
jgi:hypothetical protein